MPWNGSGVFNRSNGVNTGTEVWQDDAGAGVKIRADRHDTHDQDIVDGMENTITRDGQNSPSANLPMNNQKHTGVAAASGQTSRTEYLASGVAQDGDIFELGSVSGTDTITASASPAVSAYVAGQTFRFVATGTNTGATTININSAGAKAIQKLGAALVAGDITSGDAVEVYYDGTQFQMLSPARTPVLTDGAIATAAIANNAVDEAKLKDALIGDFTEVTVAAGDSILLGDADDSGNTKRDTVQGILDLVTVTSSNLPDGTQVQVSRAATTAVATGTTAIPWDDTIPQNTEGTEVLTAAITPNATTNLLRIDVTVVLSHSTGASNALTAALFQDTTADALAAASVEAPGGGEMATINFTHYMTAGTTSATTFKVRAGGNSAGTTTFNGTGGSRKLGGVCTSSLIITETVAS